MRLERVVVVGQRRDLVGHRGLLVQVVWSDRCVLAQRRLGSRRLDDASQPATSCPTEKQPPADAEALSHKLMVRAGLVRQLGAGLWTLAAGRLARAPEGRADRPRGDGRDRRPGDADAGAQPGASCGSAPAATAIDELFKLQDRRGADLVLAMTHEEVVTFHVAQVVRSYRDLPLILYHFQIKERDEPRPRAGVLRTREFIMKDAYTFDRDARRACDARYEQHRRRLRPHLRPRRAGVVPGRVRRRDDGRLRRARVHGAVRGGRERRRARARLRGQRRGRERRRRSRSSCREPLDAPEEVQTPGPDDGRRRSPSALGVPGGRAAQGLPGHRREDRGLVLVVVRGDHRVNDIKLAQRARRAVPRRRSEDEFAERIGPPGYIGPVGADVPILLDDGVAPRRATSPAPTAPTRTCAASSPAATSRSSASTCARVEAGDTVDGARDPDRAGDRGRQHLQARHALLRAARRDLPRRVRHASSSIWMGSYGIGPARIAAAAVEQFADEQGISWPRAIAPWDVHLVGLGKRGHARSASSPSALYDELRAAGLDVALRRPRRRARARSSPTPSCSACPLRLTVGRRTLESGEVEAQVRRGRETARASRWRAPREAAADLWRTPPVERRGAASRPRSPLTFRRLSGLDRSGPPPPADARRRAAAPVDDPERDRLRPARADPGLPRARAVEPTTAPTRCAAIALRGRSAGATTLDGIAARVTGQYCRLGALLDPLVDRLLVISRRASSCWHFELLPRWALAVLAARELFMLVARPLRAAARRRRCEINWLGALGVSAGHGALFFALCGRATGSARCCLYVGLVAGARRDASQYVRERLDGSARAGTPQA